MALALASTWTMFIAFGSLVCIGPISYTVGMAYQNAFSSVKVLQGLWRNDLVSLKGACPNCGEEVFAFVRIDRNIDSPHKQIVMCVCECLLEFRTNMEVVLSIFSDQFQDSVDSGFMGVFTLFHREEDPNAKGNCKLPFQLL
ncbi:transmembrane protein, putative [Medicago truncatula]|uniref:Transmembrane protein, putative n=1 Tax=Medicago truncatula TaxID=3880 RepID=A0A072UWC5_MEDTR|nr:transmembrane protein, putative [Medicago truncatula]